MGITNEGKEPEMNEITYNDLINMAREATGWELNDLDDLGIVAD